MSVRFELRERDGLARTGTLEVDGAVYPTPALAHVDTERYPAPEGGLRLRQMDEAGKGDLAVSPSGFVSESPVDRAQLRVGFRESPFAGNEPKSDFAILPSTSKLMLDSATFVKELAAHKSSAHLLEPLYCSVVGLPHRLAFLVYCGFDVFDTLSLIMASENGSFLFTTGVLEYSRMKELPCSCPACSSGKRGKKELLRHNQFEAENELRLVRHAISIGRLRELVESRVRADPWLVQNLRLLDLEHYNLQELHAPVKGSPFHAGSKESLSRPDIVRWRKRLESRYVRPAGANILLLIPCSAKKPYSLSRSHMRFRQAIIESGRADAVHEVIVTSPIGLVPRELELFYPAQDYDIPVTGHWDRDEKRMVEEMVAWLVSSQRYDLVVSHLGDEREPVNSVLRDFVDTSQGDPGSRESLQRLTDALRERAPEPCADRGNRLLQDMTSLCRFQFGPAGERLCQGVRIYGRWPNLKILSKDRQLGMLTGSRGMVSLTIEGGQAVSADGSYSVEIDDFVPKGNLFAIGAEKASPEIRIGDDVAVVHGREVRAVGVAMMTPQEMELAERGEAVHIRHVL